MTIGLRQSLLSFGVLGIVLVGLVSVDDRVRDRFTELLAGGAGVSTLSDRLHEFGGALVTAIQQQSIENAPLLIFATVGAVLFLFMVRT